MPPHTASSSLRSRSVAPRTRAASPAYPALLCAVAALVTLSTCPEARADDAADASSSASDGASDTETGSGVGDDVQYSGCSATPFRAGPAREGVPPLLTAAALLGLSRRRRRTER
ncbi:MAG TPA: hypothetical protein PLI95_15850 [Polyangiaceae bacterium]|nr:hypothetical protein [Polyangiaceae bacterium]